MRILFVSHWAPNLLIFRKWMLQEAVRLGHEVHVLCPADPEAAEFADMGIMHHPWILQRGNSLPNLWFSMQAAKKHLQDIKPDSTVVYCVQPIVAILGAWKNAGMGKLTVTFTGMGSLWTDIVPPSYKKIIIRKIMEWVLGKWLLRSNEIHVLNRFDSKLIQSWIPSKYAKRVHQTLGEGVDLVTYKPAHRAERENIRNMLGLKNSDVVIGFVGRLIHEKGVKDLFKIAKSMLSHESYKFLIAGDIDLGNPSSLSNQELLELIGLPNVIHLGWQKEMYNIYNALDVLLFLSFREGFPITPLEAMACGVPVVAFDRIGVQEAVPNFWRVNTHHHAIQKIQSLIYDLDAKKFAEQAVIKLDRKIVQKQILTQYLQSES